MTRRVTALLVALASIHCAHPPPPLPPASPETAGGEPLWFYERGLIDWVLRYRVATGARSGYVALVARDGQVVHGYTEGWQDIESQTPMTMETRFRMASMTKPITATAAMILVERGQLNLDDPVSKYLPAYADMRVATNPETTGALDTVPQDPQMRVRHLLMFTSGIGGGGWGQETTIAKAYQEYGIYKGDGTLGDRIERLANVPLYEQPGTKWRYGASLDVMARVVEIASGQPFDVFLRENIFEPLGMRDTFFPKNLPEGVPLATLYGQNDDGELVLSDRTSYNELDWTPGGSGLVSTAPDYMRFALMLWNRGEYDGVRILRGDTVDRMTALHVKSGTLADFGIGGLGFGYGVSVMADPGESVLPGSVGDYWWSGAYGTHFWISPATGTVTVVLQQNTLGPNAGMPVAPYLIQGIAN